MKVGFLEVQFIFILLFYLIIHALFSEHYVLIRQQRLHYHEVPLSGIISV